MADFAQTIATAYATDGAAIDLGRGVHDGAVVPEAVVKLPLRMVNRHGLIAGATGTGKTKTLQGLAEQLSTAGVPVFVADVKGDLSGVAEPGEAGSAAAKRAADLGQQFQARGFPVEFFALGGIGPGIPIRATVSDFGPQLLAKVLDANETQEQSLTLVFHYADAKGLPLLDLSDLRALLSFLISDEGKPELAGIGGLSSATVGVLLRSMVGLEDGGGNEFFGEPMLDVHDLMRTAPDGRGIISCLELPAVQDKPKLFSTALMWLLAELFEALPEAGDLDKPKLAFFFDEAHLLFEDASKAFLTSVAQTVRLIRSKGVGVYFITQTPKDVPSEILGQLGNRVQHALRAFTPEDAKALKATVGTFPKSPFYDLETLLTGMGIGEAAVTILSETGVPTPVVHTRVSPPASRMGPADDIEAKAKASPLWAKYGTRVDNQSAREILAARLDSAAAASASAPTAAPARAGGAPHPQAAQHKQAAPHPQAPQRQPAAQHKEAAGALSGGVAAVSSFLQSSQGKKLQKEVVRGVFGMLKKRF
jgi:DNA double-strand break repair helicase HerA and related ATPase